ERHPGRHRRRQLPPPCQGRGAHRQHLRAREVHAGLEVSPFLQNVNLMSQTQTNERDRAVYAFVLEMDYQEPTPDAIETQPLFAAGGDVLLTTDTAAGEGEGN